MKHKIKQIIKQIRSLKSTLFAKLRGIVCKN